MSEYWKSTPKYWCKHCKTYVRDTKLEKTSHEATPKHQGNLKRFLRDLHRGHEREERETQRAKSEVERLNGVVTGVPATSGGSMAPWKRKTTAIPPAFPEPRQASVAERKQQLAQLADMGVAIPDEFRREMAMAGDWQTLSETPIYESSIKKEEDVDVKPDVLSVGVRKRKYEDQEEDGEAGEQVGRKAWGSTFRTHSEAGPNDEDDLDALLASTGTKGNRRGRVDGPTEAPRDSNTEDRSRIGPQDNPSIKREYSDEGTINILKSSETSISSVGIKQEDDAPAPTVVFKKRKANVLVIEYTNVIVPLSKIILLRQTTGPTVFFRFFGRGLQQGWFKGHPYEVVPGGLNGVETGLKNLKEGKASAVKYVFRIADTNGVSRDFVL